MGYAQFARIILLEANPMVISRIGRQFARRGGGNFLRDMRGRFAGSSGTMSKRLAEKARPKTVYIASPLGFPGEGAEQRLKLKSAIEKRVKDLGHNILDPWRHEEYGPEIGAAFGNKSWAGQRQQFRNIATRIAKGNEKDVLEDADAILAVFHKAPHVPGVEIDAGTVAEAGMMRGRGKPVYTYRDASIPDVGDFPGIPVNLQAEHLALPKNRYRRVKDINF
jgi:nucleoside 2-deoxyribosyltransferase